MVSGGWENPWEAFHSILSKLDKRIHVKWYKNGGDTNFDQICLTSTIGDRPVGAGGAAATPDKENN